MGAERMEGRAGQRHSPWRQRVGPDMSSRGDRGKIQTVEVGLE